MSPVAPPRFKSGPTPDAVIRPCRSRERHRSFLTRLESTPGGVPSSQIEPVRSCDWIVRNGYR